MKPFSLRATQRAQNLKKAFSQLEIAVMRSDYDELQTAGLIQTFEFTFELVWKLLKDICDGEGFTLASPRDIIRQSSQLGLINNPQILLDALEKRNIMTHTYNEQMAQQAVSMIRNSFEPEIRATLQKIFEHYE